MANRRRSKNHILLLKINGEQLSNQNAISDAFFNFYRELIITTTPSCDIRVYWEEYYTDESRL